MSAAAQDPRRSLQAVKVVLSELYIRWLSSRADDVEALARDYASAARATSPSPLRVDPVPSGDDILVGRASPPPMRGVRRGEDRTPSPVHGGRGGFIGVDELDFHRAHSPGGASPVSPNAALRAVVDPKAPLPAPHAADADAPPPPPRRSAPPAASDGRRGGGAPEVPPFYRRGAAEGAAEDSAAEMDAMNAIFAKGPHIRRSDGPQAFHIDPQKSLRRGQMGRICGEVFRIPLWLGDLLHRRICAYNGLPDGASVTHTHTSRYYTNLCASRSPNRRLFDVLRADRRDYLTHEDLRAAVKYLVEMHSGLEFLKQPEFQDYYCRTVAIRIVYHLEKQQSRRVTWKAFNQSDLPEVMRQLDSLSDINHALRYFSYEHFYVLYCKFWELDTDHDQLISLSDLRNYSQGALTNAVLSRVMAGAGRRLTSGVAGKMDFEDFVYFCLSEEDKNTSPAVEYWFKVLDVDGDGILSGFELAKFFEEQAVRFNEAVGEELKYEDMLCQMLDMVGARRAMAHSQGPTLGDLRASATPSHFFNMIFNANKFLAFEHRDPFLEHQMKMQPEKNDWDRYARTEYDRMASEVGG